MSSKSPDVSAAERSRRQLKATARFAERALQTNLALADVLQAACQAACEGSGINYSKVLIPDAEHGDLTIQAGVGWRAGVIGMRVPANARTAPGATLLTGKPQIIADLYADRRCDVHEPLKSHGIVSAANVPIALNGTVLGVLELDSTQPMEFNEDDLAFLHALAAPVAAAILRVNSEQIALRTEQRLRESEERLRVALEAGKMGTWLRRLSTGEHVLDESLRQLMGLAPGQTVQTVEDFLAAIPEDRAAVDAAFAQAVQEGGELSVDFRVVHPDGSVRWLHDQGRVLTDSAGQPDLMAGACLDITERHVAEARLRDSEQRLRLIAENVAVGQFSWDLTTGLVTLPRLAREAFGIDDRPVHIDRLFEMVPPEDLPAVRAGVEPAFNPSSDGAMRASYRIVRADGSVRWVDSAGQVQFETQPDGTRRAVHAIGVIWDVTEHRQLAERLREADERKNEFLAMLAHELRNPLAPLTNAHRLIERTEPLTERGLAALALAQRQTRQLRRLVDDLLEINRITLGKIEIRCEPVSVAVVVHAAVESVAPAIEQRAQTIEAHVPPAPVRIQADPMRIAQVLENLLTNASKYTPEGGAIRIEVAPQPDAVEIRVVDDGIGIEPAKIAQLFEVFHQIDATIDRAQGGLGIGLALVKRLVELHGGTVRAESSGVGRGATFIVRLPRAMAADSGAG